MTNNYYLHGAHNVICDRCGLKYKSPDTKLEKWSGLISCYKCYEVKPPALIPIRPRIHEALAVKNARTEVPISPANSIVYKYTWEQISYPINLLASNWEQYDGINLPLDPIGPYYDSSLSEYSGN